MHAMRLRSSINKEAHASTRRASHRRARRAKPVRGKEADEDVQLPEVDWEGMPEEILQVIFSTLPLMSLVCQVLGTCKRWRKEALTSTTEISFGRVAAGELGLHQARAQSRVLVAVGLARHQSSRACLRTNTAAQMVRRATVRFKLFASLVGYSSLTKKT